MFSISVVPTEPAIPPLPMTLPTFQKGKFDTSTVSMLDARGATRMKGCQSLKARLHLQLTFAVISNAIFSF